jgi:hypothetical protein
MILQLTKTAAQFCVYASKVKHKHYSKENLSRNKVILPLPSSLKFDLSLLVQLTVFIDLLTSFNVHQEHKGNANGEFICMPWIEL